MGLGTIRNMKITLYEGDTITDLLGEYECEYELLPEMTVAIGKMTYRIYDTAKNAPGVMSVRCKRSTSSADSPGVIPLTIARDWGKGTTV